MNLLRRRSLPVRPGSAFGPRGGIGWLVVGALTLGGAHPLFGQALERSLLDDLEFRGVGVDGGRVWAERVEPTYGFGIRLDLGWLHPDVRVTPLGRFWASTLRESEVDRLASQIILVCERQGDVACPERLDLGEVKLSDLEMGVDFRYELLPARPITPFLGLGVALHLLNGRGDFINGTFVEDLLDSVTPGFGILAGLDFEPFSALGFALEGRAMLGSDVRYASVNLGAIWVLPTPRIPDPAGDSR